VGGRESPFPITLAIGLYNSLYYRTSRDELVFEFQVAEKSTWRNGKSLHLSTTNFTQVKDQSTASEIFIFGGKST